MRRATVLAYHAVGDCPREDDPNNLFVSTDAFAEQMRYLARRRRVVSLDEAISDEVRTGPAAVAITFDDAYRMVLDNAAPILDRHGFPATVFVPTAWIGRRADWLGPSACDLTVMDEAGLRRAIGLGISLESHGERHAHLPQLDEAEARADVARSAERLEAITGRRPEYFAYPYGDVSAPLAEIVREAGYRAAFAIDRPGIEPFVYERTSVTPLDGPALFAAKTSGRYLAVRHARVTRAAYAVAKPALRRLLGD